MIKVKKHSIKCKSWLNEPCNCSVGEKPCKHGVAVCLLCIDDKVSDAPYIRWYTRKQVIQEILSKVVENGSADRDWVIHYLNQEKSKLNNL